MATRRSGPSVPQRHEHLSRARQTEQLALALNRDLPVCIDWAVAMLFYAALHYIDAFLAGKSVHPMNHKQRDEKIERNGSLSGIYGAYRRLKDLSRAARYEIPNFPPGKIDVARDRLPAIKRHLQL
jgi:hypothetical protein